MHSTTEHTLALLLCWLALSGAQTTSFDIFVTEHPKVLSSGSTAAQAQFGFAAAFHTTGSNQRRLLVGAPRDEYSNMAWRRAGVTEPGVLYSCETTGAGGCVQLAVDTVDNVVNREQKSYMRMGHSVGSSGSNTPPLVCAPHFHRLWTCDQVEQDRTGGCFGNARITVWDPSGKCVVLPPSLTLTGTPRDYTPSIPPQQPLSADAVTRYRANRGILFNVLNNGGTLPFRFTMVGSSLDMITNPTNTGQSLFSVGGPAYLFNEGQQWKGTITHSTQQVSDSRQFGSFLPHHLGALFAYDSAQGNFFGNLDDLEIAVGVPRAQDLRNSVTGDGSFRGEVRLYSRSIGFADPDTNTKIEDTIVRVLGTQVAEHFGSVVTGIDTNADGFLELFVGAPMFTNGTGRIQNNYDHGRVAVFDLTGVDPFGSQEYITGNMAIGEFFGMSRSRFGSSIQSLGDLDYDGFNDVAIGAPYEGSGIVYIFMGSQAGVRTGDVAVQRVGASAAVAVAASVTGMGFALATLTDIDDNGVNDLAATSVASGHALVFRARPVINGTVEIMAPFIFDHTRPNCTTASGEIRACFDFRICGSYSLPRATNLNATFSYDLEVTPRLSFQSTDTVTRSSGSLVLTMFKTVVCVTHTVFIERSLTDPCAPADITVRQWNLVPNPSTATLLTPVLSRGARPAIAHRVQFVDRCMTCNPQLISTIYLSQQPMLNARHAFEFPVTVMNTGTAFACAAEATFSVISSPALRASIDGVQVNRSTLFTCPPGGKDINMLTCRQRGGLAKGASSRFIVRVVAEAFSQGYTADRIVNITVTGSSSNQRTPSPTVENSVPVQRNARLLLDILTKPQPLHLSLTQTASVVPTSLLDLPDKLSTDLRVVNEGPGAMPPFMIDAIMPTTTAIGGDILYLTNLRSTFDGVTCATGSLLDPLKLADTLTDVASGNSSSSYPVAISTTASPRLLPCPSTGGVCSKAIMCSIPSLLSGQMVTLKWSWRLNAGNLQRSNVSLPPSMEVRMQVIRRTTVPGFTLTNTDASLEATVPVLITTVGASSDEGVNIWIIIGAILGAVALFAIVVLILWKAGFFKRKRVDKSQMPQQQEQQQQLNGGNTVEAEADDQI